MTSLYVCFVIKGEAQIVHKTHNETNVYTPRTPATLITFCIRFVVYRVQQQDNIVFITTPPSDLCCLLLCTQCQEMETNLLRYAIQTWKQKAIYYSNSFCQRFNKSYFVKYYYHIIRCGGQILLPGSHAECTRRG